MGAAKAPPVPDPEILPAVRDQVEQAVENLRIACALLRSNGWPENARELRRSLEHVGVWTMPDGWLACLERD